MTNQTKEDDLLNQYHNVIYAMCLRYNEENIFNKINLIKYNTTSELIFNLWEREVDLGFVGEILFGKTINDSLTSWVSSLDNEDEENANRQRLIENCNCYKTYLNSDQLVYFLSYCLLLESNTYNTHLKTNNTPISKLIIVNELLETQAKKNMLILNKLLINVGYVNITNYEQFRQLLRANKLTKMQITYLAWECEYNDLTNIGRDIYEFIDNFSI